MSDHGLAQAQQKMRADGLPEAAINVFSDYYRQLESGQTGLILEETIEPLLDPPLLEDVEIGEDAAREALGRAAIIKLNGGLGTSMGLDKAKNLLPVREGMTFLDIIVRQVLAARKRYGVKLPLLLMNSFRTAQDTEKALAAYPDLAVDGLPLGILQNREPKLTAEGLEPVDYPEDPSLEWCPPGHGDLYPALLGSGVLKALVDNGFRYACVSNADNLGSAPSPRIAAWFAASGAPYAAEVCRRTPADVKGGYLVRRKSDGRLVLRETAQTPAEDAPLADDLSRHRYFHTNNLWFDLPNLLAVLTERGGVLDLPLIRNTKTVDPADPSSPAVIQIESAMGAAVQVFDGARAIEVPRSRFLPVKTTNDLLLVRSDVYELTDEGALESVTEAPLVDLDSRFYKLIGDFDQRFPAGPPSLRGAESLTVRGDWTFGADVRVQGAVALADAGSPQTVAEGVTLDGGR